MSSTTTTTTTRADHSELFTAVPQQADDDEARADLRLLDDDYVDPLACAVAGPRWSALELAAYGSHRYGCGPLTSSKSTRSFPVYASSA